MDKDPTKISALEMELKTKVKMLEKAIFEVLNALEPDRITGDRRTKVEDIQDRYVVISQRYSKNKISNENAIFELEKILKELESFTS